MIISVWRCALLAMSASSLLCATPASACSVVPSYRVPSNFELVEQADAIVIGQIESGGLVKLTGTNAPTGKRDEKVRLKIISVVKGEELPSFIDFDGARIAPQRWPVSKSDPQNLMDANPDAYSGGCNRYLFNKGMILVAFLRRAGARWHQDMAPFARTLEDVPSMDAAWVKVVRLYARIAAMPKPQRVSEMRRQRDLLAINFDDPAARLMVTELDRALHLNR